MDGFTSEVEIDIDEQALGHKLDSLLDDQTMLRVHNLLAKMCDPYVPFMEGTLSQTVEITPEWVRYIQPYSHYIYTGAVYGPNIPIMENGVIVGWFSPPGQKKHPTGASINYSTSVHPQATSEWDKVMMQEHGEEFTEQVKQLLLLRARELYG